MKNFKYYTEAKTPDKEKELEPKTDKKISSGVPAEKPIDKKEPEPAPEPTEPEDEKDAEKPDEEDVDSEIGDWSKAGQGWVVKFSVKGSNYVASFFPLDEKEKHWKFTYFQEGQRDSSDIKKFGDRAEWPVIWKTIIEILRDFLRIFKPETLKFIGMSASKRNLHYKEVFKLYVKKFLHAFKRQGFDSSFDIKDITRAPSFVIRKGTKKEE